MRLSRWTLGVAAAITLAALITPWKRLSPAITHLSGYCGDVEPQRSSIAGAEPHIYRSKPGRALRLHVFRSLKRQPSGTTVMLFFGGGWRGGNIWAFERQATELAADGHTVILPDYRVSCRDGTNATDSVVDANAAYNWVRAHLAEWSGDNQRIVIGGGSAGGHLALITAMKRPRSERPAALLLFNPAVDIVSVASWTGLEPREAAIISPALQPVGTLPPTIIFHGTKDSKVPIGDVRTFCTSARVGGRNCELIEYEGKEHGFFHSERRDAKTGIMPFADTLARSRAFLARQGL